MDNLKTLLRRFNEFAKITEGKIQIFTLSDPESSEVMDKFRIELPESIISEGILIKGEVNGSRGYGSFDYAILHDTFLP
ncbi:8133_t:CDS:2 [Racocetra persica]|uniref:8133_t:CDS:1 n=1 Tax=Racocetra persica TaxID=160502 RepID=A0ACA9QLJ8_9GLOM|nr:8133_t:CDS:2 [Racocetra persica]